MCPVHVYKVYREHRPAKCCSPGDRFYLQPTKALKSESDVWFTCQPLGKNSLANIAKNMATQAGLGSANRTNHSARKTAIETLLHRDIPPTSVMQLTGHKNVQSLNSYSNLSVDQQREVSLILSSNFPQSTNIPSTSHTGSQILPSQPPPDHTRESEPAQCDDTDLMEIPDNILADFAENIERNLVLRPSANCPAPFSFGNIYGNVTINVNQGEKPAKRRRLVIASDSETEE